MCNDQVNGFTCDCQAGYDGDRCENSKEQEGADVSLKIYLILISLDINECESNPCQNEGECIDQIARFECNCAEGYEGDVCDQSES